MADTVTAHYDFVKPEVSGSNDTWGDKLNANWQSLDSLLYTLRTDTDANTTGLAAVTLAVDGRIPFYGTGAALPTSDIGPIWHADYAAIMTWDGVGYASLDVGVSKSCAFNFIPAGHLLEDGSAVSRTTYAALFRRIGTTWGAGDGSTTFNLPDSRGEFHRGFDKGRGVDSGRTFASSQGSQNLSHAHGVNDPGHAHGVYDPGHKHDIWGQDNNASASGGAANELANVDNPTSYNRRDTGWSGTGIGIYGSGTGISIQSSGGSEARGRNVTRLYCIKF